jgi:hypothetical protein
VLGWSNIDNGMAKLMRESMTDEDAYHELKKFENRRKLAIRSLSRLYRDKRDVQL